MSGDDDEKPAGGEPVGGELVELPERKRAPLLQVVSGRDPRAGGDMRCIACTLQANETTKTIRCPRCGQVFEPFEAVLYLSRRWQWFAADRDSLAREVRELTDARDKLRTEVANLKAQRKRAKEAVEGGGFGGLWTSRSTVKRERDT